MFEACPQVSGGASVIPSPSFERDHLTRFAALTDLSPGGGEVIRPKNFSSPGGEVGEGGARTG